MNGKKAYTSEMGAQPTMKKGSPYLWERAEQPWFSNGLKLGNNFGEASYTPPKLQIFGFQQKKERERSDVYSDIVVHVVTFSTYEITLLYDK